MIRTFCLAVLMAAAAAWSQSPDGQFAFADSLQQNGEDAFAMLEFKRFVFLYPEHAKAPEAFYRLARLYVSHDGDVAGAQDLLNALIGKYARTPVAREAAAFRDFIGANADAGGERSGSGWALRAWRSGGSPAQPWPSTRRSCATTPRRAWPTTHSCARA